MKGKRIMFTSMFKKPDVVEQIKAPSMRTVMPSDAKDLGFSNCKQPTSRMDVLQVIEDNVQNEIESINHELSKLNEKILELKIRKYKYTRILEAAKEDVKLIEQHRADHGVIG